MSLTTKLRFEVLREIGRGSLGVVYKAVDPNQQKILALREIPRTACSAHVWDRLRKKAQAAIALDSPNIVRTLEVGEANGCFYVVTEYVEGVTLRSLLERKTAFSGSDLVDITRQVCSAVDHAHGRGLVHGNLHPHNCMQEWDGNIKLMDYDQALDVLEQVHAATVPQALHYISPEQAEGNPLDRRSNLFSWAAILYEMATGHRAFDGDNAQTILGRILDPAYPLVTDSVALPLDSIKKSLAKSPELRYQCGDDFVHDLETWRKPNHGAVTVVAPAGKPRAPLDSMSQSRIAKPPTVTAVPAPVLTPQPLPPIQKPAARIPAPAPAPVVIAAPAKPPVAPQPNPPAASASAEPARQMPSDFLFVPSRAPSAPVCVPDRLPEAAKPAASKPMPSRQSLSNLGDAFRGWDRRLLSYGTGAAVLLLVGVLAGWGIRAQSRLASSRNEAAASAVAVPAPPAANEAAENMAMVQDEPAVNSSSPQKKRKKPMPAAAIVPQILTAELAIDSAPSGAQIELDGAGLGSLTPYTIAALSAGEHTITLTKAGYAVERRGFQVHAAERLRLSVTLVELEATIAVSSDPEGGAIFLNGKDIGKLTPASVAVRAGNYKVSVAKGGFFAADKNVELTSGQRYEFSARLTPMGNAEEIKAAGKLKRLFGGSSAAGEMVQIRTKPKGARISVNQRALDKATPAEFLFPAGFYDISLELNGYQPVHKTVQVGGNGKVVVDVDLQRLDP